ASGGGLLRKRAEGGVPGPLDGAGQPESVPFGDEDFTDVTPRAVEFHRDRPAQPPRPAQAGGILRGEVDDAVTLLDQLLEASGRLHGMALPPSLPGMAGVHVLLHRLDAGDSHADRTAIALPVCQLDVDRVPVVDPFELAFPEVAEWSRRPGHAGAGPLGT